MTPVEITWHDAFGGDDGWEALAKDKPRKIKTCGYLAKPRVKGYVTVVLSRDTETGNVAGFIHIPEVNIDKIRKLR